MHDFDGVPPYIDAMTSLVIDNKPVLIFIRENLVLITPKTGGMLWEFELNEVFPASPDFNDQYFIDDIIRLSNTRLLLALGTTFCTFELHRNQQWKKPYLFTSFGCSSLDTGGMLAYIDAAMTAPRDRIPFVIVFNDWHVYEFPLDQFSKVTTAKLIRLTCCQTIDLIVSLAFW